MSKAKPTSALLASDVMTRKVLAAQSNWPVEELAEFLVENSISGASVVDESGELVGVVSLSDLARSDTRFLESDEADRHAYYLQVLRTEPAFDRESIGNLVTEHRSIKVSEIMTPMIIDVAEDTPIAEVATRMIDSRVHRILVTREGRVVGIITTLDMLRVLASL